MLPGLVEPVRPGRCLGERRLKLAQLLAHRLDLATQPRHGLMVIVGHRLQADACVREPGRPGRKDKAE